jgi:hypothetical protein
VEGPQGRLVIRGTRFDEHLPSGPLRQMLEAESESNRATARYLSERFGVTERTTWRWLRQIQTRDTVSIYIADAICSLFGLPLAYVYIEEAM